MPALTIFWSNCHANSIFLTSSVKSNIEPIAPRLPAIATMMGWFLHLPVIQALIPITGNMPNLPRKNKDIAWLSRLVTIKCSFFLKLPNRAVAPIAALWWEIIRARLTRRGYANLQFVALAFEDAQLRFAFVAAVQVHIVNGFGRLRGIQSKSRFEHGLGAGNDGSNISASYALAEFHPICWRK